MKNLRVIIVGIICICLCLGYYYYISHRTADGQKRLSEVEQVITLDLDKSYPKTPRETVKFYNRLIKCFYNEKYTDDQLKEMGEQARKLMDDELAAKNPEADYLERLKLDIKEFEEGDKDIVSITISTSNEIEFKKVDGKECAYVYASYFIKGDEGSERSDQTYILRKDEEGKWKILGYYQP